MSRTARNIVEAIQHSLLGSLAVALAWWGWLATQLLWILEDRTFGGAPLIAIAVLIGLWVVAWFLGFLARSTYPTGSPFDGVSAAPENGFDVWRRTPDGGLRPSGFMRGFVTWAGRSPERRPSWIAVVLFVGCLVLYLALAFMGDEQWAASNPSLDAPENRHFLALGLIGVMLVVGIRAWASKQRAKLTPLDD